MIRVVTVDDSELIRLGLHVALSRQIDMISCGTAADGSAALELVARTLPDVVIMDVAMPGMSGLAATRAIRAAQPEVRVLMLTASVEEASISAAVDAGAAGYVLKGTSEEGVLEAIRAVYAGRRPACDVSRRFVDR